MNFTSTCDRVRAPRSLLDATNLTTVDEINLLTFWQVYGISVTGGFRGFDFENGTFQNELLKGTYYSMKSDNPNYARWVWRWQAFLDHTNDLRGSTIRRANKALKSYLIRQTMDIKAVADNFKNACAGVSFFMSSSSIYASDRFIRYLRLLIKAFNSFKKAIEQKQIDVLSGVLERLEEADNEDIDYGDSSTELSDDFRYADVDENASRLSRIITTTKLVIGRIKNELKDAGDKMSEELRKIIRSVALFYYTAPNTRPVQREREE